MSEAVHADMVEVGHDETPYLESDDGSHRPHVGEAIELFDELRDWF